MIKVDLSKTGLKPIEEEISNEKIRKIHKMIVDKTGPGASFLGWYNWPNDYDKNEYQLMQDVANQLRQKIDYLLVIGIGGSYLGTRAADEMIRGLYHQDKVKLIYVGNTISATYTAQIANLIKDKAFGIVVISKSGTTAEPGIAFRVFEKLLIDQVGIEQAKQLIVAITDANKGALKTLADQKGYQTFTIPDDIGGRFSVLTPVGIFPLMIAGINTDEILAGAQKAFQDLQADDLTNLAYQYAATRYVLNQKGYKVEALVSYEIQLQMINEWWKQLFGESEGKDGKALLPTSMIFTTDLHSMGQWVQEGTRNVLFETVIKVNHVPLDLKIPVDDANIDGLNYLTSKTFHEINKIAFNGVVEAHSQIGKMPNILLEFEEMNSQMFGYLVYWFERAVAMSAYLLGVNPFDQPGVEVYKQNMFKLLGKPENN